MPEVPGVGWDAVKIRDDGGTDGDGEIDEVVNRRLTEMLTGTDEDIND